MSANVYDAQNEQLINIAGGSDGLSSVTADVEVSPAENFHAEGTYLTYNHNEYLVLKDIAIGTALDYESADPNIELANFPDGTYINTDDGDGEGGGTSVTVEDTLRSTSTTNALSANQGNVIAKDLVEHILTDNTNTTGATLTVGTHFLNSSGQLCKVTTDIPVNGTVTLNTNCEAITVGGELTELNSKTIYSGISKTVDLSSYTSSSSPYYTENDGILTAVLNSASADVTIRSFDENGNEFNIMRERAIDGAHGSLYLKKGFPLYVFNNAGTGNSIKFYCFSS